MSQKKPSVGKNYLYNTFYQVLTIISPLITAPYISRIFGADGVGIQSFTNSVVVYFTLFAALGTASYGAREIARCRDDREKATRTFWEIQSVVAVTVGLSLLLWMIVVFTGGPYRIYYGVLTLNIVAVLFDISWLYRGFENFKLIVIRNSIVKLAGIVLLFAVVRKKTDVALYMAILAASGLLGNISMWSYLKKFVGKPDFHHMDLMPHFRETLVYFIPSLATSVYTMLDKTMIGIIVGGNYESGYYEQATKIINIAKTFIFSLNTVMSTRMSYLFGQNKIEEAKRGIAMSLDIILMMGIAFGFGIAAVAPRFVPLFFGDGYDNVTPLLIMLCPIITIIGISNCLGGQYFTPAGRRRDSNKVIVAGSIVNLCLNAVMIPFFHAKGAVIASVAAETVITTCYLIMGREYAGFGMVLRCAWKRVIAGVVMFFVCRGIAALGENTIPMMVLSIAAGAVTYFAVLLVLHDGLLFEQGMPLLGKLKRRFLH